MQEKRNYRKNPFSLFFIMMLMVAIAVSVGFYFFYYSVFTRASQNEAITIRTAELRSSEQYLANLFDAVIRQINSISYSKEIYTWDENSDYEEYHAVMDVLRENKGKHSAIHSIYAVFEEDNLVLTANEGYFQLDSFYDDTWEEYGTGSFQKAENVDGMEISDSHYLSPRSINGAQVVSLICEMNLGNSWEGSERPQALLVVNLFLDKIIQIMDAESWEDLNGSQEVAIMAANGSLIYDGTEGNLSRFSESELNDLKASETQYIRKRMGDTLWLCQKEYFAEAGWYLLRISSMEGLYGSAQLARNAMLAAAAICVTAIGIVLVMIWKRVYLPYSRLMDRARKGSLLSENGESMEYLEELIAQTLDTKEFLWESWFERVFLGGVQEETDHEIINLSEFCVLEISVHQWREMKIGHALANIQLNSLKACIKQYMLEKQTELPVRECYCIGMTDQQLVVLLETEERVVERKISPCISLLFPYVSAHRNVDIYIGVSAPHIGVEEMHQAYLEAKDALSFHYFFPDKNVFYYEKTSLLKRDFYIENSVKVDIFTNNLYGMRIEEAKGALEMIVADLRKELESIVYYNLPNFFSRLFERVYRAVRNIGMEPEQFFNMTPDDENQAFNTWEFDTMDDAVKTLYWMLDRILEYQQSQENASKKSGKQWARIMLEYVDANYDKGISLASMAEDLGLDESYLSKQFKEKVGVSFIQYVTKCKMDKAKEMLQNPSIKLAEIAEHLGIGNVQSFIRTFKKYEGMTPGQYRESCLQDTAP